MELEAFDAKYAALWSGIIGAAVGSLISYFSVRASNKSSLDRLTLQITADGEKAELQRKHDAEQKNEDRKAAIRREVYVEAVNEVTKLLGYIGSLPQRDLEKDGQTALTPFMQACNKLWLVADSRAAHLTRELTSLFMEFFFRAMPRAYDIRNRQIAVNRQMTNQTLPDAEIMAMRGLLAHRQLDYLRFVQDEIVPINMVLVKTVSALRAELHLVPDEEMFMEQLGDQQVRARKAVDLLFQAMANVE